MAPARDAFVIPGTYVDPTCPINWEHPLSEGLVGLWRVVANPGWSGSRTFHDLVRSGHNPHDGALTSGVTWGGPRGMRGGAGSIGCTGGAYAAIPFPAVASTDDYALVITHRPTTWPGTFTCLMGHQDDWSISFDTSGNLSFANGSILSFWSSGGGMTAGQWWQVVITRIAGTSTAYVNAVKIISNSSTSSNSTAAAGSVFFGDKFSNGAGNTYDGLYGEIAFYSKRGLSLQDTQAYYQSSCAGHPELLNYLGVREYSFPSPAPPAALSPAPIVLQKAAGLAAAFRRQLRTKRITSTPSPPAKVAASPVVLQRVAGSAALQARRPRGFHSILTNLVLAPPPPVVTGPLPVGGTLVLTGMKHRSHTQPYIFRPGPQPPVAKLLFPLQGAAATAAALAARRPRGRIILRGILAAPPPIPPPIGQAIVLQKRASEAATYAHRPLFRSIFKGLGQPPPIGHVVRPNGQNASLAAALALRQPKIFKPGIGILIPVGPAIPRWVIKT